MRIPDDAFSASGLKRRRRALILSALMPVGSLHFSRSAGTVKPSLKGLDLSSVNTTLAPLC